MTPASIAPSELCDRLGQVGNPASQPSPSTELGHPLRTVDRSARIGVFESIAKRRMQVGTLRVVEVVPIVGDLEVYDRSVGQVRGPVKLESAVARPSCGSTSVGEASARDLAWAHSAKATFTVKSVIPSSSGRNQTEK